MRHKNVASVVSACTLFAASGLAPTVAAELDHEKSRGHVVFGGGLNTNQPGNRLNHVVLPQEIKIKAGGVVDFAVAGFHDIVIFKPGFTLANLIEAGNGQYPSTPPVFVIPPDPATALPPALAFLGESIYYRGLNPAGGPLQTPVSPNPSNVFNRSEPSSSSSAGRTS